MEQCIKGQLRESAIKDGLDMEAMDKEFTDLGITYEVAVKNVRKKRGWIKHLLITLWEDFPIPQLGYTNPEIQKEWDKLNAQNRRKVKSKC